MAWIESHQEIGRHPKTRKMARLLDVSVPATVGHLHLLWHWCIDFAEDGDLSAFGWDEIADGALWEGDARTFVQTLIDCGWMDADEDAEIVTVHDWDVYTGRIQAAREANRERQRRYRDKQKEPDDFTTDVTTIEGNAHVTVMKPSRNGATVPNRTVPNPTELESENSHSHVAADAATKPKRPRAVPKPARVYERNPTWDALGQLCGEPATASEKADFGLTAKELVGVDATPDEIAAFGPWWWQSYPDTSLTHRCLRNHFGRFRTQPVAARASPDAVETVTFRPKYWPPVAEGDAR